MRHGRPEVGAADTDVHDSRDPLPRRAAPLPSADRIGEGPHPVEDLVHLGDDVISVDDE